MRKNVGVGLVVVAGLTALLFGVYAVVQLGRSNVTNLGDVNVVKVGPVDVPVSPSEPIATGPDRFLGLVGPEPSFDTSELGPDLSFQQGEPDFSQHEDEDILRAVYLGADVEGRPYWIYGPGSRNPIKMIGQMVADFFCFCRLATSYGTLFAGEAPDDVIGFPGGGLTSSSGGPTVLVAEWYGLPSSVAVVAVEVDGEPIGWQRIVGGTAAVRIELPRFEIEFPEDPTQFVPPDPPQVVMTAYDDLGENLDRTNLFRGPADI